MWFPRLYGWLFQSCFAFGLLFSCALFPFLQSKRVSSSSLIGGCLMSLCSRYSRYSCRYWGRNAVQSKTYKSEDQYMLCVLPDSSFDKYCARLTSCGQCLADLHCGWCDDACVSKSKAGNCKSYTGQGQNCPVCAAAKSCDTCVSNPSCGWCHSSGDCSSVKPRKCAHRAGGKCDKPGMVTTT